MFGYIFYHHPTKENNGSSLQSMYIPRYMHILLCPNLRTEYPPEKTKLSQLSLCFSNQNQSDCQTYSASIRQGKKTDYRLKLSNYFIFQLIQHLIKVPNNIISINRPPKDIQAIMSINRTQETLKPLRSTFHQNENNLHK